MIIHTKLSERSIIGDIGLIYEESAVDKIWMRINMLLLAHTDNNEY